MRADVTTADRSAAIAALCAALDAGEQRCPRCLGAGRTREQMLANDRSLCPVCYGYGDATAFLLGLLADAVEEFGSGPSRGLRLIGNRQPNVWPVEKWGWRIRRDEGDSGIAAIPEVVWDRLPNPTIEYRGVAPRMVVWAFYTSRSLAFLALAEALIAA